MSARAKVIFSDTNRGIGNAVREVFSHFGGAGRILKESGDVYIKINAVDLKKHCYTDPEVLRETILYFKQNGARDAYVIENCTQGNFTRLVFKGTGIGRVCRDTGAIPVFLDETGSTPVYLETLGSFTEISDFVHERLVEGRDRNLYLSIPKLKTHSMSQVTLSIKNQFGFVHQASRIADHNFKLHQKFADIYRVIRPDFALVDGTIATNHGHYVAERYEDECVVPTNCLIGGIDPLAVDTIAASFLGYELKRVKHLALAAATGIGQGDIRRIEIANRELYRARKLSLTHELLGRFPDDLIILRGRERCCPEGCRRNTETVAEVFHADHNGKGGFTILMGRGIDPREAAGVVGRAHIAGGCAIEEYGSELVRRLGRKNVTMSNGCNNLSETIHGLCRQMGVSPLSLVHINPVSSLAALLAARIKGTRALVPPVF